MATETIAWIQPDGTEFKFDGTGGVDVNAAPAQRFMPPVVLSTQDVPDQPGTLIQSRKFAARTVTLNLAIRVEGDKVATRHAYRALLVALDPTRGDGRLRFTTVVGDTRDLVCSYADGLQGDDGTADPALTEYLVQPSFLAQDPFFTDPADSSASWAISDGGTFFPILPLRLTSSQVFATPTITNGGDIETYPVWTIKGPGSGLVLTHMPTGRRLAWGGTLGAGETLTIDTRSSILSSTPFEVFLQDGTNRFADLTYYDMWPLSIGTQVVQIELTGATTDSLVSVRWRNRYLGV